MRKGFETFEIVFDKLFTTANLIQVKGLKLNTTMLDIEYHCIEEKILPLQWFLSNKPLSGIGCFIHSKKKPN